jgi:hypothetical protein
MNLDTGSNFIWVTSSLCRPCTHYGNAQFHFEDSNTFAWIEKNGEQEVTFGPWGTMTVKTGKDVISLPGGGGKIATFYLATHYDGDAFEQLDWDGGIGIPAGSAYVKPGVSFFVADLMDAGLVNPELPFIAFDSDPKTRLGSCRVGGIDFQRFDPARGVEMRWHPYRAVPDLEYIWATPLAKYQVGDQVLATSSDNVMFCLDSGSSEFKGDDDIMGKTCRIIDGMASKPTVFLTVGRDADNAPGQLTVTPSVYEVIIEAGPRVGQALPQFNNKLGATGLVLAGSVLMDLFYTVYEYDVTLVNNHHELAPVAMYLFDKPGSSLIAQSRGRLGIGQPKPLRKK